MDAPYGPFAPDLGGLSPGFMLQADGVQPIAEGYAPFPSLTVAPTAVALPGDPRGIFSYQTNNGTWDTVACTATAFYLKGSNDTWNALGTGLITTAGDDWAFVRFGSKLLLTNTTAGLYQYDVEAGGASLVAAAQNPRQIFTLGGIVFGLDTLDSTGTRDNRLIRTSARSDHTNWSSKGADYQHLEDGGALIWGGSVSDNAALILQRSGVKLITLGGPGSALWSIQTISVECGAVGAKSVVSFGGMVFWLGTDGWYMFSMAGGIKRIGAGLVDQWFLGLVDQSDLSLVQGCFDPLHKNVLWRWKRATGSSSVVFADLLGYCWEFNKWFTLTTNTNYLGYSAKTALTWGAVDAATTWATFPDYTWGERLLQGGEPVFGALDGINRFGNFAGGHLDATLETALFPSGTSQLINRVTPIDDAEDGSAGGGLGDSIFEIGVRDRLSDDTTWKPEQPGGGATVGWQKATSGRVATRARGKYLAFRRTIRNDNWSFAKGVDYLVASSGGRR